MKNLHKNDFYYDFLISKIIILNNNLNKLNSVKFKLYNELIIKFSKSIENFIASQAKIQQIPNKI